LVLFNFVLSNTDFANKMPLLRLLLVARTLIFGSSFIAFFVSFSFSFYAPLLAFFVFHFLLHFPLFSVWFFITLRFYPSFSSLFSLFFLAHVGFISGLPQTCLGLKGLVVVAGHLFFSILVVCC
jgi:hypothetical protein